MERAPGNFQKSPKFEGYLTMERAAGETQKSPMFEGYLIMERAPGDTQKSPTFDRYLTIERAPGGYRIKKRSPRLTRLEKLTKGLATDPHKYKSRFTIHEVKDKGRSLFLHKGTIKKGSFVLEYEGDLISNAEAKMRDETYKLNKEGCYILYFKFQDKRLAIDATRQYKSYARYLSHSTKPNIRFHSPIVVALDGQNVPRLAAYALRDIHEGEEIDFDYGVRDKDIPWLKIPQKAHKSELPSDSSDSESRSEDECESDSAEISVHRAGITPNHPTLPSLPLSSIASTSQSSSQLPISPNGYGIRFKPYFRPSGKKTSYVATIESLPEPKKIFRFIDDCVQKKTPTEYSSKDSRLSSHPLSVISLSSSEPHSKCSSPSHECERTRISFDSDNQLPRNNEPTSTYKVMEWQCQNSPISNDIQSNTNILGEERMGPNASHSTSYKSSSLSSVAGNVHSSIPQISEVVCGRMVPQEYIPHVENHSFISSNNTPDATGLGDPNVFQISKDIAHITGKQRKRARQPSITDNQRNQIIQNPMTDNQIIQNPIADNQKNQAFQQATNIDINGCKLYMGDFQGTWRRLAGKGFKADNAQDASSAHSTDYDSDANDAEVNPVGNSETLKTKSDSRAAEVEKIEIISSESDSDVECVILDSPQTFPPASAKIPKREHVSSKEDMQHSSKNILSSSSKVLDHSNSQMNNFSIPSTSASLPEKHDVKDVMPSFKTLTSSASASPKEFQQVYSKTNMGQSQQCRPSASGMSTTSGSSASHQPLPSAPVAVVKPYNPNGMEMKAEDKKKLTEILGPHILSKHASKENIQNAINNHWNFFKELASSGVTIEDIRASVRRFAKEAERERRRLETDNQ